MRTAAIAIVFAVAGSAAPAYALQTLIPTPYPQGLGSTAERIPSGIGRYHQHLIADPVPEAYGPNAQGNPRSTFAHRHQHLLRSPYPRYSGAGARGTFDD